MNDLLFIYLKEAFLRVVLAGLKLGTKTWMALNYLCLLSAGIKGNAATTPGDIRVFNAWFKVTHIHLV